MGSGAPFGARIYPLSGIRSNTASSVSVRFSEDPFMGGSTVYGNT